jgi:hypothetical protein
MPCGPYGLRRRGAGYPPGPLQVCHSAGNKRTEMPLWMLCAARPTPCLQTLLQSRRDVVPTTLTSRGRSTRSCGSSSGWVHAFDWHCVLPPPPCRRTPPFNAPIMYTRAQVTDIKLVLQQWVMTELSTHCAAIERLTATAELLGAVDPTASMLR